MSFQGKTLRRLFLVLRRFVVLLLDQIVLRTLPRVPVRDGVLVVRIDAIGDFVLWLDSAREFRRIYPKEKLTLIANGVWADIAMRLPFWDDVIPIDVAQMARSSRYRRAQFAMVRSKGFARAVQPTYSRVFHSGDCLIFASGASERIGVVGDLNNMTRLDKWLGDALYTRLLPSRHGLLTELERNAEFISNLTGKSFTASIPTIPRLVDLPERLTFAKPYLIAFPGASVFFRQWSASNFALVASRIGRERGLLTLVCGSVAERDLCQEVADQMSSPAVNLAGETSLSEFVEIVRGAKLLIGNETSAIHFAAAVGTPSVCVLGGGHFERFVPYPDFVDSSISPKAAVHIMPCFNCDWRCSRPEWGGTGPVPCIRGISQETVLIAAAQALSTSTVQ